MRLFDELRRRNVYRAAVAYVVVAWLVLQVADITFDIIGAPLWAKQAVLAVLVLGFPVAILLSWLYRLTPDGVEPDAPVASPGSEPSVRPPHLTNNILLGLVTLAVLFLLVDEFLVERAGHDASAPELTSLAVLPFVDRNVSAEDEAFVHGLHGDVVAQLGQISSLKVISRTSVQKFADSRLSIPEIAEALDVDAILEGSVQRSGLQARVVVTLIDGAREQQLWTRQFDRELTTSNVLAIQSEIAEAVTEAMHASLSDTELDRIGNRPTDNFAAYEAFLIGRDRLVPVTAASIREARQLFERAIELDPGFAGAHVGLADTYLAEHVYREERQAELIEMAQDAVDTAFGLKPGNAEAFAVRGAIRHSLGDYDGARADVEEALRLNGSLVRAMALGAELKFLHYGDVESAFRQIDEAIRTDPLAAAPRRQRVWLLLFSGRLEEATEALAELQIVAPDDPEAAKLRSMTSGFMGNDFVVALHQIVEAAKIDPENPTYPAFIAVSLLETGFFDEAGKWLDLALELGPEHYEPNDVSMFLALYEGRREDAFQFAETAVSLAPRYPSGLPLSVLAGRDVDNGELDAALARYASIFPGLFEKDAVVRVYNYRQAIDVAYLLLLTGDRERSEALLSQSLELMEELPPMGLGGVNFYAVRAHAARGDYDAAIAALGRAVDAGVVLGWPFIRDHDYVSRSLAEHPGFEELDERLVAAIEGQRDKLSDFVQNELETPSN